MSRPFSPSAVTFPPPGNWSSWTITLDDRKKHDDRFQSLRPVSGYITGEQARNFFTQSKLPNAVLAQIWSLADLTNDGKLDKREFSIAMALIKKCLEGNQLPPSIPPGFLQEPISSFLEPRKLSVTETPTSLGLATNGADSSEWSIPPSSRPKYRLQFNQNDRTKRGYLTGVEARGIFMSSHLPQSTLAYIWNLADIDNDGNLTCDEFCIAAYLIDQALAGRTLPPTLPPSLIPVQAQGQQVDPSRNLGSSGRTSVEQNVPCDATQQTFEDKRMQNFLLGQAELDRRKQDLAEKLRQDEEARREQARLEAEKQEKLRLEQERRRQKEAEKEAEHQRNLEAQREARRQQATAAHIQALKEAQRQKALELEKARVEALAKERAAEAAALEQAKTLRASLLEAAASLATRRQTLEVRLSEVQSEYEGHRRAILEMGNRRDALERESVDLSERVEAGRAELHRWQREHEQLSLRVTTSVDANQASEHHKTLVNDLRQLNESKQQLEHRLTDLNSRETLEGQTLASHRRRAKELEKTHASLVSEVRALRATLGDRQKAYREDKKRKASMAAAAAALTASAAAKSTNSSTLSSGPTETYVALYSYTPSSFDELAFTVGDKILIHKSPREGVGDGWLYGELNGKRGLVPATYVKSQSAHEIFPAAISDPFAPVTPSQTETGDSALVASATVDEDQKRLTSTATPLFTCIALYDFKGHLPGDLSLKVGEKVNILNEKDGWYEGVSLHSHQSGMFPANYVEKLPSTESSNAHATNGVAPVQPTSTSLQEAATYPTSASTTDTSIKANQPEETAITVLDPPELAIVESAFTADGVGQLTLVAKQYVKVQRKSASGWWEGEIQQRGQDRQVGWFPASCVRVVSSTSKPPVTDSRGQHQVSPTTVVSAPTTTTTENKSLVQAKYAYKAAQPDELTFEENALIEVLNHEEEGWWRGRLTASGVEGLFPVNYVQPYNNAAVDGTSGGQFDSPKTAAASSSAPKPYARSVHLAVPEPRDDPKGQRLKTILEFIDTEHIYYLDLLEVKEIFYDELERRNVGATVLYEIFGRWPSLVLLSQAFYKELNERRPQIVSGESEMIGDIMFSHLPRCFVYRDFCAAQDARLLRLTDLCEEKPELAQLIKACERRTRAGVLPLASYFIKPVQRISKYKLLIEKILKYTAKDHPDLKNLKQSFQLASVVLDACNEAVRNRENVEQLLLLQERVIFTSAVPEITFFDQIAYLGSRSLILSGKLFKVKSGKELVVFLFNDMLFLTVPQSSSSKDTIALPLRPSPKIKTKLKVYREPFYYTDMVISDFIDNRRSRKSFAATLRRPSGNYAASVSNLANLDLENSSNSPRSSAQRARSTSVTSLAEPLPLNDLTFLVARSNDPSTSVHLRAASNSETENWISTLRQAQAQYHCAVEEYKVKSLDEMTKSSSFVAALSVTVISASDLMPSGGENKGIPSPFCVVSVCLRSRKTNVVLLRRSPTWNIGWKFPVGDVNRDVVTLTVYGRRDHQADEFLGRAEVPVSSIAQHTSAWQTTLPLSGVASGRITASFLLEFPTGGVVDDVLLITPNGQ